MSNKDKAMNNFQNAIDASNRKKQEEENRKKQEQKEQEENKKKQKMQEEQEEQEEQKKYTPSNEDEQEPQLTEEEQQKEDEDTSRRYNIYDDDDEDEDEQEDKDEKKKRKKKDDGDEDEDEDEDGDEGDDNQENEKNDNSSEGDSSDDKNEDDNLKDNENKSENTSGDEKSPNQKENPTGDNSTKGNSSGTGGEGTGTNTGAQGTNAGAQGVNAGAQGTGAGAQVANTGAQATNAGATGASAAGSAGAAGASAPLWVVILVAVGVILIIMILIGYISFFINGPAIIRDKILKFADGIWTNVKGFFVGQDTAQVKTEHIISVAEYLEEMGYNLVGHGFIDTDGKWVTEEESDNGDITIKSSEGKVILKKEKSEDTENGKITKIKSKYIKAYLVAENNTYMIANQNFSLENLKNLFDWDDLTSSEKWFSGMIHIENSEESPDKISIDRENKKMKIKYKNYVYVYDLDGWTGRYGKSIEFLLTMHLSTMAPDFAYDVATMDEFATKVNIALYPVEADIKLKMAQDGELVDITQDMVTEEQWEKIQEYTGESIQTFTPFITNVKNHWYKDLDFTDCYAVAENTDSTEDDEAFTKVYAYEGLGEEDDVLTTIDELYVEEVRKKDIFQIKEPSYKKNEKIKDMLLNNEYYIYNGSELPEGKERKKQNIVEAIELEQKNKTIPNTKTFTYAFAILEGVHSEDAEYVLRDLKELFKDVGIEVGETENKGGDTDIEPLTWPIKDYKPIVWDPLYNAQAHKVIIKHKTDTTLGFDKDIDVLMPADGKIVEIEENEDEVGSSVKIELTGTDRKELKGMYIYISGLKSTANSGGTYSAGEAIGTTTENDIIIVMTDSNRKAVQNVDDYFEPEDWDAFKEENETDEIQDSEFKGNVTGNTNSNNNSNNNSNINPNTQVAGDHNVNTASGEGVITDKNKLIAGLQWYKEINPQGYKNIVDNIDAFMQMQDRYHVNAAFAISIAIMESSAGTNWSAISPSSYNWMSLKYANGNWKSYSSFAEAINDFGGLIGERGSYFKVGNYTVSQISQPYCGNENNWQGKVNSYMDRIISGAK